MSLPGPLRYLAAKLGRHYPRVVLAVQFQSSLVVVGVAVALLTRYQEMTTQEFLRLLVVIEGLILIENVVALRMAFRLVSPADRWLRGDHGPESAVEAWRALAELPSNWMRRRKLLPILFTGVPWCLFATWELDLHWYGLLLLLAGTVVVVMYGLALRYFLMELSMRPVLEQVSSDLPRDFDPGALGVPLQRKLLISLPALTVVTGVTISALSTEETGSLNDLGWDVAVAFAIAATVSLYATLLLSRSIVGPIKQLRDATRRVGRGDLDVRVPVLSADETGSLAQSFNAAVAGLAEREKLREAFGSYVDPDLAEKVLSDGAVLEGEEVEVTVMFLDIRDFTAFAERAGAREVVRTLNDFWECVVPVLVRHRGHANKFIGDGLLGVFGAPDHVEDHPDRAVAAACEIAGDVRERYGDRLRVGIGVNTGPVVAGTVGGGGKLDFTVIGDTVNTTARVEAQTRETGDDVLVTDATRERLREDRWEWKERPAAALKGKSDPVRLWAPQARVAAAAS